MPNAGAQGYYRWALSSQDVKALLAAQPQLSLPEQVSLASNLLAAMRAGALSAEEAMVALAQLARSPDRPVLETVLSAFAAVEHDLLDDKTLVTYRAKLISLLEPTYRELGLLPRASAGAEVQDPATAVEQGLKRAVVVRSLALSARDPALSSELAKFGRAELGVGTAPPGALQNDLRDEAISCALREDPKKLLETAIARLLASEDAQERARLLSAISTLEEPTVSSRILDLALEPRLRTNERLSPLFGQAARRQTHETASRWLEQHFDTFVAQLNSNMRPRLFALLGYACAAPDIERERAFLEPHLSQVPGADHEFALALESAQLCEAFRARQSDSARAYFAPQR
jgi:alanyl aminopeptidase